MGTQQSRLLNSTNLPYLETSLNETRLRMNSSRRENTKNILNSSMSIPVKSGLEGYGDIEEKKNTRRKYQSIDVESRNKNKSQIQEKDDHDKILEKLSKKNEDLRKDLRLISDKLTQQLRKKKLFPKNTPISHHRQSSSQPASSKQLYGIKKELETGYKHIELYKKKIISLKSKQEGKTAEHRMEDLQNEVAARNMEIQKYIKTIEGLKKVKDNQDAQISLDLNSSVKYGVENYKIQSENLKAKLKKIAIKNREREPLYKKQQAYMCDLERKIREMEGSYFPNLSNTVHTGEKQTQSSSKELSAKQFEEILEEVKQLRIKHSQYNRKIQLALQMKSKRMEEQNHLTDQISYKERIIEALKLRVSTINKLLKPRRKRLFGEENYSYASQENSFDNQSELERQLNDQLDQDQFDIKHLLANIPKPDRKKNRQNRLEEVSPRGGISISQKSQPKKWGLNPLKIEERGKHFKGQLIFSDKQKFDASGRPYIVGMNVWLNKNNSIIRIQAIYNYKNQVRYGAKSSDSSQGILRKFDVQINDFVKNLTFTTSQGFVESITLFSKEGKIGKFGTKRDSDENHNFGISSTQRPCILSGASSFFENEHRLHVIGIEICHE